MSAAPVPSPATEQALLGGLMFLIPTQAQEILASLDPALFADPPARVLGELLRERARAGLSIAAPVVQDLVRSSEGSQPELTHAYVVGAVATACEAAHLPDLLGHVRQNGARRDVLRTLRETALQVQDQTLSPDDALARLDRDTALLSLRGAARRWTDVGSVADDYMGEITDAVNGAPVPALPTGYARLDALLKLRPGMLVLLAGRPGLGKTALALNIGAYVARTAPVGIVSLEMSRAELISRLVASESGVSSHLARMGQIQRRDLEAMERAYSEVIYRLPLHLDDSPMHTLSTLRASIRALVGRYPSTALVVVDYLQLLSAEPKDRSPREQIVASFSRGLKAIARELGICVMALSQLNRDGDGREPRLSDLRESGALEQDADAVLLLHRPDLDHTAKVSPERRGPVGAAPVPKTGERIPVDLILAKHRAGPCGRVGLRLSPDITRFESA